MSDQMTLPGIGNATSSQESADGHSPPALPDGPTTANCGPARRPASRSPSQGKAKPKLTNGICGPTYFASPVPDGPLSLWESRLRQRLASIGSTECLLTWKASVTPAGRSLSRLVPSMRPTEGIDSGLWPTPTTRDHKDSPGMSFAPRKDGASRLDLPPRQVYWIEQNMQRALWPTPTASLADKAVRTQEGARKEVERGKSPDLNARAMALWPTPCARDHMPAHTAEYIAAKKALGHGMSSLSDIAPLGMVPVGSSDTTEKPGALNPQFVCWLMGFPPEWDACAPMAMPSSRKSRPNSSARSST